MRLDNYVVESTLLTKNKAQALIKSWSVIVNNKVVTKAGYTLWENDTVDISETQESKYVARSAMKLKLYLEEKQYNLTGKTALDIWSSTWWFCQILLENWVKKIYAVDVWTSQLHESLRTREEIISLENTDIRDLKLLPETVDIITCDVSFIKLEMILDAIISHITANTTALVLFKPQFEVWKNHITRKWVVKDEKYTIRELNNFLDICRAKWLQILSVENSQMKGELGNQEIFIEFKRK